MLKPLVLGMRECVAQNKAVLHHLNYLNVFYDKDNKPSRVGWILPRCKEPKYCLPFACNSSW